MRCFVLCYSVLNQVIDNATWCQERQNLPEQNGNERACCEAKQGLPEVREEARPLVLMHGTMPLPCSRDTSEGDVRESQRTGLAGNVVKTYTGI